MRAKSPFSVKCQNEWKMIILLLLLSGGAHWNKVSPTLSAAANSHVISNTLFLSTASPLTGLTLGTLKSLWFSGSCSIVNNKILWRVASEFVLGTIVTGQIYPFVTKSQVHNLVIDHWFKLHWYIWRSKQPEVLKWPKSFSVMLHFQIKHVIHFMQSWRLLNCVLFCKIHIWIIFVNIYFST